MKKHEDKILKELVQRYIKDHNKPEYWANGYNGIILNLKDQIIFKVPSISGKINLAIYYTQTNKIIYLYECDLCVNNDIMSDNIDNNNFNVIMNYDYKIIE